MPGNLLRISSPPTANESFMGYIMRLTEFNGYDTPAWILDRCGIDSRLINVGCSFVFNASTDLTALAQLTGTKTEELTPMLCRPALGRRTPRQFFFGSPVPKLLIRLKHPKVCPPCLLESGHHRKIWDLATVTACPRHKCLLLDVCPACGKKLAWYRRRVSVCRCEYDWRATSTTSVDDSELKFVRLIYARCGIDSGPCSEPNSADRSPFQNLELENMLVSVVAIAGQLAGNNDAVGKRLTSSRKNEEVHSMLVRGFSVFEDWPQRFNQFLEWKRSHRKDTPKWGINQDFGGFFAQLKSSLSNSGFDFLRVAFEEYLKAQWDGGLVFDRLLRLTKHTGNSRRYLSQKEVIQELRLGEDVLNRLIEEGVLKSTARLNKKRKVLLFDRENVEEVKQILETLLPASEVATILDVRLETVIELIQKGGLTAFDGPTAGAHRYWKISTDEIKRVYSVIDGNLAKVTPGSKHKTVAFKKVVHRIISYGLSVSDFVKAMLDGEIAPSGKVQGGGLSRYEFAEEHLRGYIERHKQKLTGPSLQMREVMKALGIQHASAIHFIKSGLLPSKTVKIGNSTITVVPVESMDAFNSTYVLATKAACSVGTSPSFLIRCLGRNGIQPVCGGGRQKIHYVYRRADFETLNIEALVSEAKAGKVVRSNLGEDRIISLEEASEHLDVGVTTLIKLVNRKIVKPYSKILNPSTGRYYYLFRLSIIDEIRNIDSNCAELVTTSEAAKMLGESDCWFLLKWVYTKRVRAIKFKHARDHHFFLRPEIRALAQFKQKTVSSKDAAKILNIGRITVYKWTVSGKLRLASGPSIDGFGNHLYLRRDVERLRKERDRKAQHMMSAA